MNNTTNSTNKPLPETITPGDAYELLTRDPETVFLIDVRTTAEYEFVGHPDIPGGAHNIPLLFYPDYSENENFAAEVAEKIDKESARLITICRSGPRAEAAAALLLKAGYKNVLYIRESFEGDTDDNGLRTVNGWKNDGLPYTYRLNKKFVYRQSK